MTHHQSRVDKKCQVCEADMYDVVPNQKYCRDCAIDVKLAQDKERGHEPSPNGNFRFYELTAGDKPCDGCENRDLCGLHKLACRHFYLFSELRDREAKKTLKKNPSKEYYLRVFAGEAKAPTIREQLLAVLRIGCNGHGMHYREVFTLGMKHGFCFNIGQAKVGLNALANSKKIYRVGVATYHFQQN